MSEGRTLAVFVTVDGVTYPPGPVDAEVAARIENASVFSDSDSGDSGEAGSDSDRPAGNASTETWADYARSLGIDVPDGATRADIVDLVDAQG